MSPGSPPERHGTVVERPTAPCGPPPAGDEAALQQEVTVLEVLDRVLDKGVVLSGDITLSVADVDLVHVGLRVLLSSVEAAQRQRSGVRSGEPGATPRPAAGDERPDAGRRSE